MRCILRLMIPHQSNCPVSDLRRKPPRFCHTPILSRLGVCGNPGAIQTAMTMRWQNVSLRRSSASSWIATTFARSLRRAARSSASSRAGTIRTAGTPLSGSSHRCSMNCSHPPRLESQAITRPRNPDNSSALGLRDKPPPTSPPHTQICIFSVCRSIGRWTAARWAADGGSIGRKDGELLAAGGGQGVRRRGAPIGDHAHTPTVPAFRSAGLRGDAGASKRRPPAERLASLAKPAGTDPAGRPREPLPAARSPPCNPGLR